ncbi:MAG: sulfatase-like hydrolase/transferase [Melioribacteraceae bacterium]|nr:sulfatase-like hydrolase/transferase [Melioribacteraceae bacterium]
MKKIPNMKNVMTFSILLLIASTIFFNSCATMKQSKDEKPNIVYLLSDDQAWTDYGFMGHPDIKTPNLDNLASEGLLFERGYLAAPVCRPSLASMVTGLHPFDHGITGNDVILRKDGREERDRPLRDNFYKHPGFIELLTSNGYLTHQSGKWWEGSWKDGGFTHGMKMEGRHGSKESLAIGREGLKPVTDFVDMATEQDKPFFLWYGVFLPHTPHNPPARLLNKYKKEGRALDVAKYYAMCEWLDETCGELLAYLKKKGALENTLIVYICDNGWAAKSTREDDPNQKKWNQYALRSKTSPYENGIRTPIMLNWQGKIEPKNDPNFAHSIDLFPTIAAAAGIKAPEGLPGINLLDEKARNERKIVFGSVHSSHNISLENPDSTLQYLWGIEGDWKLLIRYHGMDKTKYKRTHNWDTAPVRLYNLAEDPHEENEVSEQFPEIVERLKAKIEAWHPIEM